MAIGGLLIIVLWRGSADFGIVLLAGGGIFAVRFGIEARRRYARRARIRTALAAERFAQVPDLAHLPDGDRVTFNDAEGSPARDGVMQDSTVVFLD